MAGTSVGAIQIDLVAGLATFKDGMQQATGIATRETRAMSQSIKSESYEARASLALLSEEFGVSLPRHLRNFIAEIPGVGTALATAFGSVAILALIEVILKVIDKIEEIKKRAKELEDAISHASEEGQRQFRRLQEETLSLQAEVDDLAGKHVKALQERLAALDAQTLDKLANELDQIKDRADKVLDKLKVGKLESFFGFGNDEAVEKVKTDLSDIAKKIDDLKNKGGDGAKAAILGIIDKQIQDLKSFSGERFNEQNYEVRKKAEAEELEQLQLLRKEYDELNKQRDLKGNVDTTRTAQTGENNRDAALKSDREISDERAKLAKDSADLQVALAKETADKLHAITEDSIHQEQTAANTEADAKLKADQDYYSKIIANHKLGTEEDQKTIANANKQLEIADLQHQDALVRNAADAANKIVALHKQEAAEALALQRQQLKDQEETLKNSLSAQQEKFTGEEKLIKLRHELGQTSNKTELTDLLALFQAEYKAQVDYLDSLTPLMAQEIQRNRAKNGVILSDEEALAEAKAKIQGLYDKAKIKLQTDDLEAQGQFQKQSLVLAKQYAGQFTDTLAGALAGSKTDWANYFQSIEQGLIRLGLNAIFKSLFSNISLGGFDLSGLFRAGGGGVNPGQAYIVGERQPELFVPDRPGTIVPSIPLLSSTASGTQVSISNQFIFPQGTDPDSFMNTKDQIASKMNIALHNSLRNI